MTIAAGFICSDGIILCADTEHSDGENKYQHQKIFSFGDFLLVTGAGTTAFLRMTFDKLFDAFRARGNPPVNGPDAREMIEEVIREVHDEHIFKFYKPADPSRPEIGLIIAVRCGDGKLALIKTADTAVYLSNSYEVTGIGQPMFEYWASYLHRDTLDMDAMTYLAFFMLKEAKKRTQGCGGYSVVVKLGGPDFRGPMVHRFFDENRIMADFPDSITRVLSVIAKLDVSDRWIEEKLQEFCHHVLAVRQAERQAKEQRDKTKWP
jgi:20S proteasome alpha/beta subunit